ncbi:hypothetical protein [Dictyobacter formicarum]|nr:hypothetical protein [Dictyobacter formicarum]
MITAVDEATLQIRMLRADVASGAIQRRVWSRALIILGGPGAMGW